MTTETTTELSPEVRELLWLCGSAFTGIIENDKTTMSRENRAQMESSPQMWTAPPVG